MSTAAFIDRMRELHEQAKAGTLPVSLRGEYDQARREFGRLMVVAQQMHRGGQTLRANLRIAQLIKVELDLGGPAPEKTSTMDLASGGFAAFLPVSQPVGKSVPFALQVPAFPSGMQSLRGIANVASSRPKGRLFRVSLSFDKLAPADQEHLDMVIVDFVLRRFTTPG